jgi:hypothetical protein
MKFPYASYEVDPSPTLPDGIVFRPEVTVHVIGPRRIEKIQALVDTGSDETVFPVSLAKAVGVHLVHSRTGQASAVGGHAVELIPGQVTLQLPKVASSIAGMPPLRFSRLSSRKTRLLCWDMLDSSNSFRPPSIANNGNWN